MAGRRLFREFSKPHVVIVVVVVVVIVVAAIALEDGLGTVAFRFVAIAAAAAAAAAARCVVVVIAFFAAVSVAVATCTDRLLYGCPREAVHVPIMAKPLIVVVNLVLAEWTLSWMVDGESVVSLRTGEVSK